MDINLLCIGDIVGPPGRRLLREALEVLVPERKIDCVIVNAENAAAGSGLTATLYEKIVRYGTHLITLGDHVYRRRDIIPVLETQSNIVRPANLPLDAPGREFAIHETAGGHRVAVLSLLGRMYMKPLVNCPFAAAERVLNAIPKDVEAIVVEMHAEATSEKIAMGWHLDGRVSLVFGTHTHIPTADESILPNGTAYITDLGMSGPYDSVLGRTKESVIRSLITCVPQRFDVATGDPRLCGIIVQVDPGSGRATAIERVCFLGSTGEEL